MAAQSLTAAVLLLVTTISSHLLTSTATHDPDDYLNAACNATRYPSLCVRSLAGFSRASGPENPCLWARAAVVVTAVESERVGGYLAGLQRGGRLRGRRARSALADCVECLADAASELRGALAELRQLRRTTFAWQMSNVETWVSAALTSQDTCLDGFAGLQGKEAVVSVITSKVLNATHFTSNALALVNKLASTGGTS
ncbi:hypothetical protein GW17_00021492 [Ensete ventricosum]|nr:hypothetical protein GW17_00021492 [Ensete ventricosum]